MRENGTGPAIILTWDLSSGADYYYLTAASHAGGQPVNLGHGAPQAGPERDAVQG